MFFKKTMRSSGRATQKEESSTSDAGKVSLNVAFSVIIKNNQRCTLITQHPIEGRLTTELCLSSREQYKLIKGNLNDLTVCMLTSAS